MTERVMQLHAKECNLRKQYETKVMAYLKRKSGSGETLQNELKSLSAMIFGLEEQIFHLENYTYSDKSKVDFINDLSEIDFSNFELETLIGDDRDKALDMIIQKYKAADMLNSTLMTIFKKHANNLIKILDQFISKRNIYRKKASSKMLDELVYLKSGVIKHLCIIERLADSTG